MQRLKDAGEDPLRPNFATAASNVDKAQPVIKAKVEETIMINPAVRRRITLPEVEANKENNWFICRGEVYDGTGFLKLHPGGPESITLAAGEDATEDFMAIHSSDAKQQVSICS